MGTKRHKPEEIVAKLRQVEIVTAQGKSIAEAARSIGVSEQTYFRWRAEFGSMKTDQGEATEGAGSLRTLGCVELYRT